MECKYLKIRKLHHIVAWVGDGQCFIVKDTDGTEYRICISKEIK